MPRLIWNADGVRNSIGAWFPGSPAATPGLGSTTPLALIWGVHSTPTASQISAWGRACDPRNTGRACPDANGVADPSLGGTRPQERGACPDANGVADPSLGSHATPGMRADCPDANGVAGQIDRTFESLFRHFAERSCLSLRQMMLPSTVAMKISPLAKASPSKTG